MYRCRFAVELESLGDLFLLPAQATQVDKKENKVAISFRDLYNEDSRFFMGRYSNRNNLSLLARDLCSSRKLLAKKLASNMLPGLKINFSP